MVAEGQRVGGKDERQTGEGPPAVPPAHGGEHEAHERQMKRVDLGDDRLGPERVGGGEPQTGRCRRRERSRQIRCHPDEDRHRKRAGNGRREIHCARRLDSGQHKRQVAEGVIERIGLTRCQIDLAHACLEGSGVAEIKPGQERRVIEEKRDGSGECANRVTDAYGAGGTCGAGLGRVRTRGRRHVRNSPCRPGRVSSERYRSARTEAVARDDAGTATGAVRSAAPCWSSQPFDRRPQ